MLSCLVSDIEKLAQLKLIKLAADAKEENVIGPDNWGPKTPSQYQHMMNTIDVDPKRTIYEKLPEGQELDSTSMSPHSSARGATLNSSMFNGLSANEKPTGMFAAPENSPLFAAHELGHLSPNGRDWALDRMHGKEYLQAPEEGRAWLNGLNSLMTSGNIFNTIPDVPKSLEAYKSYLDHDAGFAKVLTDMTPALIENDQRQKRLNAPPDKTLPDKVEEPPVEGETKKVR